MTRPRDSLWSRVQNAHRDFAADYGGTGYDEERKLVDRIVRSAWWRKRRPDIAHFTLRRTGREHNYCVCEFDDGPRRKIGNSAVLDLGSPNTTEVDVLHAVAHYLHPEDTAWHGPEFAKAMLDTVGKYLGMDERRRLAQLYKQHKVKTVVWSQEAKDKAKSRHAERDLRALLDELKPVTPPS